MKKLLRRYDELCRVNNVLLREFRSLEQQHSELKRQCDENRATVLVATASLKKLREESARKYL